MTGGIHTANFRLDRIAATTGLSIMMGLLGLLSATDDATAQVTNEPPFRLISSGQAGGGGRSQGGTFSLEGTIGQTAAERMSGGTFLIRSGFIPMCPSDCDLGDLDCDGSINGGDLGVVLLLFGPCPDPFSCAGDLDNSGEVDAGDIGVLLLNWR